MRWWLLGGVLLASPAAGQTDYYNTDRGRPVRIEDAYTTERYALELKVAPVRVERRSGGMYRLGLDPEVAYGLLPRTSVEVGFPLEFTDGGVGEGTRGLAGVELTAFHNLNTETRFVPALAVRVDAVLPVGALAPERVYPTLTGIATRTLRWARFHVNGSYTLGADPSGDSEAHDVSRWLAGVAVDRAYPLRSLLLTGAVYAAQPMHDAQTEWHAEAGTRYQISPYLAVDAGVGRRFTGERSWYVTFGSAYHIGVRALMPVATR